VFSIEHERDIERLRQVALLQKNQLETLIRTLADKCAELEKLKGSRGELQLVLSMLEAAQREAEKIQAGEEKNKTTTTPPNPNPRKPKSGHGPTAQPDLPRVKLRCVLDAADKICPKCGDGLSEMGGQAERSEMIDVVELKYQLVEVERQKYVCKCAALVETALGPERAMDGGRYSLRFAIKVAFDKYVAHLPLERQVRLMEHHGLTVTSQTLWDQCWAIMPLLEPTYDALFQKVRSGPVLGVDQTGWPDLEDSTMPPWQMWCLTAPGVVYHRICDDKGTDTFAQLLRGYRGWVVCDAAATHQAGARVCPGVKLASCWSHVLRRFRDAAADFPDAHFMLGWIGDIYEIDRRAASEFERGQLRRSESRVVLEKMHAWMHQVHAPKTTNLGAAIRYTLRIWERLTAFTEDPLVWLDNNATERGLRGPVVGRRNHFGSKSARGTHAAAVLYTLVESAKVCGLDPIAYLIDVATAARRNPGAVLLAEKSPPSLN
jgi:transposase